MTTTIRDINELQDRRIMMEKKLPPFGYALILLTAALILFLVGCRPPTRPTSCPATPAPSLS